MRRSELARSAGCHGETVRFYERRGLLPAPPRSAAGHRVYGPEHARRLRFIRRARGLGFGLDQIARMLRLPASGDQACAAARTLVLARLADTRRKLADLTRLEQALATLVARCDEREQGACPVIDALAERSAIARRGTPPGGPRLRSEWGSGPRPAEGRSAHEPARRGTSRRRPRPQSPEWSAGRFLVGDATFSRLG